MANGGGRHDDTPLLMNDATTSPPLVTLGEYESCSSPVLTYAWDYRIKRARSVTPIQDEPKIRDRTSHHIGRQQGRAKNGYGVAVI